MSHSTFSGHSHPVSLGAVQPTGRTIAVIRMLYGISAGDLASAANLTPFSLSRLERSHRIPAEGEIGRLLSTIGALVNQPRA
jgi:hypothetical protein